MQHFPIFLNTDGLHIALAGGGDAALAKLRLLTKTEAMIQVFANDPCAEIRGLADGINLSIVPRPIAEEDLAGIGLVYAASENPVEDARVAGIARAAGVIVNIVDNLADSDFITPAIVDRDPVTVAIGTEGAAPVLARAIKRDLEERLPNRLGRLARIGKHARRAVDVLPTGRLRRDFWQKFFFDVGPRAAEIGSDGAVRDAIDTLIRDFSDTHVTGHVDFAGAGPGDPDLLTMKTRQRLDRADVVLHDADISGDVLELVRREATIIAVPPGPHPIGTAKTTLDAIISQARKGAHVVRLMAGDPTGPGKLAREIAALNDVGISHTILPGIPDQPTQTPRTLGVVLPFDRTRHDLNNPETHPIKEPA